jgi:two-component system, OmpR family, osmolarity sensor histidine kinase EnvZ
VSAGLATLFGRNLMLLFVLFVVGFVCGAVTLRIWVQKPRITQLATQVASQFRLAQAGLEALPAERRPNMRPWLNSRSGGVYVLPLGLTDPPAELADPKWFVRQFIDDLRSHLPERASSIRWVPEEHGTVWARMPVEDESFWFRVTGVTLEPDPPTRGMVMLVFFSLLAIAGAVLIQQRLNRMADALAAAETERALVLAGISHDLRTPIAKMRLAIEMLATRGEPELIASMRRSAAEMTAVTEQFLLYARPEVALTLEPTNLSELVADTVESHRTDSRTIRVELQSGPPMSLDQQLFRRALDNLLTNAVRYSDGDVEVRTQFQEGRASVAVLDRGPGIPASRVAAMRKPFARGTDSAQVPGTGLGLAIVDRIVHAHGGQLDLLARDGGGLEARITFANRVIRSISP